LDSIAAETSHEATEGCPPCLHHHWPSDFTAAWLNKDDLRASATQWKNALFNARQALSRRVLHRRHHRSANAAARREIMPRYDRFAQAVFAVRVMDAELCRRDRPGENRPTQRHTQKAPGCWHPGAL